MRSQVMLWPPIGVREEGSITWCYPFIIHRFCLIKESYKRQQLAVITRVKIGGLLIINISCKYLCAKYFLLLLFAGCSKLLEDWRVTFCWKTLPLCQKTAQAVLREIWSTAMKILTWSGFHWETVPVFLVVHLPTYRLWKDLISSPVIHTSYYQIITGTDEFYALSCRNSCHVQSYLEILVTF